MNNYEYATTLLKLKVMSETICMRIKLLYGDDTDPSCMANFTNDTFAVVYMIDRKVKSIEITLDSLYTALIEYPIENVIQKIFKEVMKTFDMEV